MENHGIIFKEIRERFDISSSELARKAGVKRKSISNFENGKGNLSFDDLSSALAVLSISLDDFQMLTKNISLNQRYGATFQALREDREIEQGAFSIPELSELRLSFFEEGKIMLPLDIVLRALEELHVSLADFEHFFSSGMRECVLDSFEALEQAELRGDKEELGKIYQEVEETTDIRLLILSAKSTFSSLDEDEVEEVSSLLFGIDDFTLVELYGLIYTMKDLPTSTIKEILSDILTHNQCPKTRHSYRLAITRASGRGLVVLIKRKDYQEAHDILKLLMKFPKYREANTRFICKFMWGYYQYKAESDKRGLAVMEKALEFLDFLDEDLVKQGYQRLYDEL